MRAACGWREPDFPMPLLGSWSLLGPCCSHFGSLGRRKRKSLSCNVTISGLRDSTSHVVSARCRRFCSERKEAPQNADAHCKNHPQPVQYLRSSMAGSSTFQAVSYGTLLSLRERPGIAEGKKFLRSHSLRDLYTLPRLSPSPTSVARKLVTSPRNSTVQMNK